MIVLSDALSDLLDEGCTKLATTLTREIKKRDSDVKVISYKNNRSLIVDKYLKLNKFFLNRILYNELNNYDNLLYIPFSSNTLGCIVRLFILHIFYKKKIKVLFTTYYEMTRLKIFLLRKSKAIIYCISKSTFEKFRKLGFDVTYLKTGIDTNVFKPVIPSDKLRLREKYGFSNDDKIVLHVGHLKYSRNISSLLSIDSKYKVLIVISSKTKDSRDLKLMEEINKKDNIFIIDKYISNIEEIYQMSDVYIFPVLKENNCIDTPLSVLEASSCNLPIITSCYGETCEFRGYTGFYFRESFDKVTLNNTIEDVLKDSSVKTRECIINYSWDRCIEKLLG